MSNFGAPISVKTLQFFDKVGLQIYDTFGSTEVQVTVENPYSRMVGSVGKAIPGVKV